ncbi:MAG TPA: glycosyltransferase [Terriglobales bacterium]|nr:glycosyltransferase [Terriglobales bacterium]
MKIVVFGLSITSAWGNGHATTFRALLEALHRRGNDIIFYEKDVEWYASNRDLPQPSYCSVRLFQNWNEIAAEAKRELADAEVGLVGSYFPAGREATDLLLDSNAGVKAFYDIDTPITIAALRAHGQTDYLKSEQIPGFDIYFSFTGGPMLREIEERFGAPRALPLYCSSDPREYRRFGVNQRFACDLSYMGTYAPDRQPKLEEFLLKPAALAPDKKCIVAGPQYPCHIAWPVNVRRIVHLNPRWHAKFYSSSRLTLNVTRREMVMAGYSPSVRLFEAAACAATIVSDNWPGLDEFFCPGKEILLPVDAADVVRFLSLDDAELRTIGNAAQERVMAEHTSEARAKQFESAITSAMDPRRLSRAMVS